MIRKLAAVLLLAGILTPYSCDVRPVTMLWGEQISRLLVGVPVLCIILYALQALLDPLSRMLRRAPAFLNLLLLTIFFVLALGWILNSLSEGEADIPAWASLAGAILWCVALIAWSLRTRPAPERFPLLLLANIGIPVIIYFVWEYSNLRYGAWLLTAGYLLAVLEEARAGRPPPGLPSRGPAG